MHSFCHQNFIFLQNWLNKIPQTESQKISRYKDDSFFSGHKKTLLNEPFLFYASLHSQLETFELLQGLPMYLVGICLNHLAKSAAEVQGITKVIWTQKFQHHFSTPFTLMFSSSSP